MPVRLQHLYQDQILSALNKVLTEQQTIVLGKVWLPRPTIQLSTGAGEALRQMWAKPRGRGEDEVDRCPLDELGRLVNHRVSPRIFLKNADLSCALAAAAEGRWRNVPLESTRMLKDKCLLLLSLEA